MSDYPKDSDPDINREQLERALRGEMDKRVRETSEYFDHEILVRESFLKSMYNQIYAILTDFEAINNSQEPTNTQFAILIRILPELLEKLAGDAIFLLRTIEGIEPGSLRLAAYEARGKNLTVREQPYSLPQNAWESLGNYKGVEIIAHLPQTQGKRLRNYQLPMPEYPAEVVIIRVDTFDSPAKFVLVVHKALSEKNPALTYAKGLHDVFDLLNLRLQELNNYVLHRKRQLQYDQERTEFMQDVLHQIRNSVGGLLEHVEYLLKTNSGSIYTELDLLNKSIQLLSDAAETSFLATEKRSIIEAYPDAPETMDGTQWVELLRQYGNIFRGEAEARGLRGIEVDADSIYPFPPLTVRLRLVRLVLFNLLQNAMKYSRKNSGTPIVLRGEINGNYARIIFTNYGLGLDEDEAQLIFERHYRSRVVKESHQAGTGIGLYLCRKIMEVHEGNIRVESITALPHEKDLAEVSFAIEFPLRQTQTQEKPTMLYVEDEHYKHRYAIKILEEKFRVVHAYTGRQALSLLREDRATQHYQFRVILLDITLHDNNDPLFSGVDGGVKLARAILQDERFEIPIVGWTGNALPEILRDLYAIGVRHVIQRNNKMSIEELSDFLLETIGE